MASLRVRAGEAVDLVIEGDRVVIGAESPQYALEQLVAAMRPEDEPAALDDATTSPVGDELL